MKELMRFTISGIIPSKKNEHEIRTSRRPTSSGKMKMWVAPSDKYQLWERTHAAELREMFSEFHKLKGPLAIDYIFHPATRHAFDASNKMESINDMLVLSEIIEDDNIFVLVDPHPYLGEMSTSGELEVEVIIYDKGYFYEPRNSNTHHPENIQHAFHQKTHEVKTSDVQPTLLPRKTKNRKEGSKTGDSRDEKA